jgi:hypothetical protein
LWSWLSSRRRETDRDCWRYDRDSMEIRWRRAEFVEFVEFVELLEFMEIRDWRYNKNIRDSSRLMETIGD